MRDKYDITELSAREVARLLRRAPAWVSEHAAELGGYRTDGGQWRIPVRGIARYQQRQIEAFTQERAS